MKKTKQEIASERYADMDAEERKYEARRRVTRMVIIRIILAALLVWVMVTNQLPFGVNLVFLLVIGMILGTLVPVFKAVKTDLKYEDE